MNQFFTQRSVSNRVPCTTSSKPLISIQLKKTVMSCFNHVNDLIELTGEGYCVLLAMKILGIESVDESPAFDSTPEEKLALVAQEIFQLCKPTSNL